MTHRRSTVVAVVVASVAVVVLSLVRSVLPVIIYNPTESVAVGWYLVRPMSVPRAGEFVLIRLPPGARELAADRQYLPPQLPLLKRIAAVAGDSVCLNNGNVFIDGELVAKALATDAAGRRLSAWSGCRALHADEIFLLGSHRASFDSRYFGPVRIDDVVGRAVPWWLMQ